VRGRLLPLLGDRPLASIDRLTLENARAELATRYARSTTATTMVYAGMVLLAEGAPLTAVAGHFGDTVETVSRVYVYWLRDDRSRNSRAVSTNLRWYWKMPPCPASG
jgi:hypothetical protein